MLYLRKKTPRQFAKDKNYWKVRDHCHFTVKYRGAAHSIGNLRFNVPNKIPIVFHDGSNYNCHFIIKELANKSEGQSECLGENTEKYKTVFAPIEKEVTKVDKDVTDNIITISYKIKFIDSARFMATSLSNLIDNLVEWSHKIKHKDCDCFLEYENVKDNSINYKCPSFNKGYSKKLHEEFSKINSRTHLSFLIIISINLFCCWKKVFTLMSIWMN